MDDNAFSKLVEQRIAEESSTPEHMMYLSFVADHKWLGAVFVVANGTVTAVQKTWNMGINPGGEVLSANVHNPEIPEHFQNRLLTLEELREIWPEAKSAREWNAEKTS